MIIVFHFYFTLRRREDHCIYYCVIQNDVVPSACTGVYRVRIMISFINGGDYFPNALDTIYNSPTRVNCVVGKTTRLPGDDRETF